MLLLVSASVLIADGEHILLRQQADSLTITLFGAPRVGPSQIDVLVLDKNGNPVLDADVRLRCGGSAAHAVPGANKFLYTATLHFPRAGRIPIAIKIGPTEVSGQIPVEPQAPPLIAYWPYFAVVPIAIVLFALNQWLKDKRRVRRLAVRP